MTGSCEGMWSEKRQAGRSGAPMPFAAASANARDFACSGRPSRRLPSSTTSCHAFVASEHVLRVPLRQKSKLGLHRLQPLAFVGGQVGARLSKLGDRLADEPRPDARGQCG